MTKPIEPGRYYKANAAGFAAYSDLPQGPLRALDNWTGVLNAFGTEAQKWCRFLAVDNPGSYRWYLPHEFVDPLEMLVLDLATGDFSVEVPEYDTTTAAG